MFGYVFWLRPANPGWSLWCACLGTGFAFTPPVLARLLGYVCLCAHFACILSLLARGGAACTWVPVLALPRQSC